MRDPATGGPHTSHTTNPVSGCAVWAPAIAPLLAEGGLADLAPTLLGIDELPNGRVTRNRNAMRPPAFRMLGGNALSIDRAHTHGAAKTPSREKSFSPSTSAIE